MHMLKLNIACSKPVRQLCFSTERAISDRWGTVTIRITSLKLKLNRGKITLALYPSPKIVLREYE